MDYPQINRIFTASQNGHAPRRLVPEPDVEISELETRQRARFIVSTVIQAIAVLALAGGLWLVAHAIDSGLDNVARVLSAR